MRRGLAAIASKIAAGCVWGLGVAALVAPARAAELSVVPSLACPNTGEIAFVAERALGRPLASVPGATFIVAIEARGRGYAARLETRGASGDVAATGERSFSAPSCDELVETLALAVALALGAEPVESTLPAAASQSVESVESEPTLAVTAPAETAATEPPEQAKAAEANDAAALAGLAWVVADSGTLPSPALGVALGVGVRWTALELRAGGLLLPNQHGAVSGSPDAGADIGLVSGSALACAPLSLRTEAVELGVCAGWELGRLHAEGTGVLRPYRKSTFWSAPRLDAELRWPLPGRALSIHVLLTAAAPLQRDEFILKDIGSVHRTANVIARAGLGIGWVVW